MRRFGLLISDSPSRRFARRAPHTFVLCVMALLGACETIPETVAVDDPQRAWVQREARLANIDRWTVIGKLGIRSTRDSWSAGIQWQQDRDSYSIRLSGPLGQGLMELRGAPGQVEMHTSDDDVYRAGTAEELMQAHAGWRVPLTGLRYWILGRPDPESPIRTLALDPAGRLAELHQLGWVVRFERYGEFDGETLPTRMTLENVRVRAKLVLRSWQTGPHST